MTYNKLMINSDSVLLIKKKYFEPLYYILKENGCGLFAGNVNAWKLFLSTYDNYKM